MGYRQGPQGYGWYNDFNTGRRRSGRSASGGQQLLGFLIFLAVIAGGLYLIAHNQHESVPALLRSFGK